MDKLLPDVLKFLNAQQPSMVRQLYDFCNVNSGSDNIAGLRTMLQKLQDAFQPIADDIQIIPMSPIPTISMSGQTNMLTCGDALLIRKRPHLSKRILLCGHMDTVYAKTHDFQNVVSIDNMCLNGPGVADMKGGLIVMLHALIAFEHHGNTSNLGWDVLINADEELGSPASSHLFTTLAKNYEAALVYEPSTTPTGTLAKNRKGSGKLTLVATGIAAHVGREFDKGKNAICLLAEAICAINKLNGKLDGLTINVGKIAGGQALNVVPDLAVAKLDVRVNDPTHQEKVLQQIDHIISQLQQEGLTLMLHGNFGRPVKQVNAITEKLFHRLQGIGKKLGLALEWEDSGGCCDGNNLAQLGFPVLDTLGVRGGAIHTKNEFILLDSLVERAALSALLFIDLANDKAH